MKWHHFQAWIPYLAFWSKNTKRWPKTKLCEHHEGFKTIILLSRVWRVGWPVVSNVLLMCTCSFSVSSSSSSFIIIPIIIISIIIMCSVEHLNSTVISDLTNVHSFFSGGNVDEKVVILVIHRIDFNKEFKLFLQNK